jgi:hypothetical protein
MSTTPGHDVEDRERALKYAVQRVRGDRAQIVEGVVEPASTAWADAAALESLGDRIRPRARALGCVTGSGNLDLPGSPNWFVPGLAVVPAARAKGATALLPSDTLLVVEIADGLAERKRKRYAEYHAPLYLVVDRQEKSVTLYSEPGRLGYTRVDGPHPFGARIRLPEPFGLDLDTSDLV